MLDTANLTEFGFFSGLSPDQKRAIAALGEVRDFDEGATIFRQDDAAFHFYGLLDGKVELVLLVTEKVLKTSIDYEEALSVEHEILEKPVVVDSLGRGDVFGWSSLLRAGATLTATARCRRPSRVFAIPGERLRPLFESDPQLGYRFMERLAGVISLRLRHRTERLTEAWAQAFDTLHV